MNRHVSKDTLLGVEFTHYEMGILHSIAHALVDAMESKEPQEVRIKVHRGKLLIERYLDKRVCVQSSIWRRRASR